MTLPPRRVHIDRTKNTSPSDINRKSSSQHSKKFYCYVYHSIYTISHLDFILIVHSIRITTNILTAVCNRQLATFKAPTTVHTNHSKLITKYNCQSKHNKNYCIMLYNMFYNYMFRPFSLGHLQVVYTRP